MEWGANLSVPQEEAEVQFAHIAASIDESMHVLLEQQVLQHAALGHEPKQVEVAAEKLHVHTQRLPQRDSDTHHMRQRLTTHQGLDQAVQNHLRLPQGLTT